MKTAIITTDTFLNHNTGLGHPERADRVSVIVDNLKKFKKQLIWKKPTKFDRKFLNITHNNKYVDMIESSFPQKGFSYLDGDTVVSPGSKEATFDAVGSVITAIDGNYLMSGRAVITPKRVNEHVQNWMKSIGNPVL